MKKKTFIIPAAVLKNGLNFLANCLLLTAFWLLTANCLLPTFSSAQTPKFYGMTYQGGANAVGVIFEWDPATNAYTKKQDLSAANGSSPFGDLVLFDCSFLPISLLAFTAQWLDVTQTDALLEWSTASEQNNSHFTLERSTDSINFTAIATIPGAGNSSSTLYYQHIDNTLPEPTKADVFYYRLKQTDFDGQFTYSNIEVLTRGSITVIVPAPNPISHDLSFSLVSGMEGSIKIRIITALGQTAYQNTLATYKGIQQIKIPLALASGMYMLLVETGDGVERIQKEFVIK